MMKRVLATKMKIWKKVRVLDKDVEEGKGAVWKKVRELATRIKIWKKVSVLYGGK